MYWKGKLYPRCKLGVMKPRKSIELLYGDSFTDFSKDVKFCLVNEKMTPEYDHFTCFCDKVLVIHPTNIDVGKLF